MKDVLVRDIMSRNVVSIAQTASVADAFELLITNRVSGLPVVDPQGRVAGIVTSFDLLMLDESLTVRRTHAATDFFFRDRAARLYLRSHAHRVEDVMIRNVVCLQQEASVDHAAQTLLGHNIRRAPVVQDEYPIGILSRGDVLRAMRREWQQREHQDASDDDVLADIRRAMRAESWISPEVSVSIRKGALVLAGVCRSRDEALALKALAQWRGRGRPVQTELFVVSPGIGYSLDT